MNLLQALMMRTGGFPVDCWWRDPFCTAIIDKAHALGLVRRYSVTQVEWTTRGVTLCRKYNQLA